MMCDNLGVSLPHVKAGKLKALAVTSKTSYMGIPAMAQTLPGFEAQAWFGVVGPPGTPSAIAEKVGSSINQILKLPDVQKRLADLSAEPMGLGPAEMAAFMKQETERWAAVIRTAGVRLD